MSEADEKISTKIMGHVVDGKGRPVGGAKVVCNGMETLTLFDGTFKFENLAPGLHTVEIELEGYSKQAKQIDAGEEAVVFLEFQLEPEAGNAKIYGYVLGEETGEPVREGGSVYLFRPTSNRSALVNPNTGFYEFVGLSSGTYRVWTSTLNYEGQKKTVTLKEGEERRQDFLINKKEEKEVPWG